MKTLNSGFVNAIPLLPMISWISVRNCTCLRSLGRNSASSTCMGQDGSNGMHQRFCIFPSYRPCKFWHPLCLSCSCLFSSLCLSCFLCLLRKTCDWMISKIWRTGNASLSSYLSSMCFLMKNSFFFLCPFLLFFCFLLGREDDHKGIFLFSGNYLCSSMFCKSYHKS